MNIMETDKIVELHLDNTGLCSVENSSTLIKRIIRSSIAARPAGYKFMPTYKSGQWDGYISLLNGKRFPKGLLPTVEDVLTDKEIPYKIVNTTSNIILLSIEERQIPSFEFRDYQREALEACLQFKTGVLKMATNAGKTLITAGLIKATGGKAVVVVPFRALLIQTVEKLEDMLSTEIGIYGSGIYERREITVTTIASLEKLHYEIPANNTTLVIDECHHTKAKTLFDYVNKIPAVYRIGMSGTPLTYNKLDDLKLIGATGAVIYEINNTNLIDSGFSSPVNIHLHTIDTTQLTNIKYAKAYDNGIVQNTTRNNLIAKLAQEAVTRGGVVLILVNYIAHAQTLEPLLSSDSVIATGKDSTKDITNKLQGMREGDIKCMMATPIFGEGIDIPVIDTLILAAGGKAHIQLLQRIGRGIRKAAGKDYLVVHDFLDLQNKYLSNHSLERIQIYESEGFNIIEIEENGNQLRI